MRIHHNVHSRVRALEIGNQYFHPAAGKVLPNRFDRKSKQLCPTVPPVVAVHARDDGVAKPESCASLCYTPRLIVVYGKWSALLDCAKSTPPGAHVSQNHESCRASIPAFADV